MAELTTGRPLFPAADENELLEFYNLIIGMPTNAMISQAKKRNKFFTKDGIMIRSCKSRLAKSSKQSLSLHEALDCNDPELIDFLQVNSFMN